MFDLGLLRKPTFVGGLIAAVGVSASVFSLLTYLIIYVQNVLGYSPVQSGVRFLFLSGMSFVAAIIAGRLTSHVPTKWLISPGFLFAAVGLFLMRGVAESADQSEWTHLIPGLIVAGIGIGMINVPLASTAVGVVAPERSGMASGRQLHLPPGRHRHRHRRPRLDLQPPGRPTASRSALAGTPAAAPGRQRRRAVTNGQIQAAVSRPPRPRPASPARAGRDQQLRRRAQPHHHDRGGHRAGGRDLLPVPDPGQGLRGSPGAVRGRLVRARARAPTTRRVGPRGGRASTPATAPSTGPSPLRAG